MSDKGGKLNKEGLFMVLNNIEVVQTAYISKTGEPHNEYHMRTENNIYLGFVNLPPNGQYAYDAKVMEHITKALALRWGLIAPPRKR